MKANVSQQEALRMFRAGGVSSLLCRARNGLLQKIADVYVPFQLFHVKYQIGREAHARIFAIDAVDGSLDLFEFPSVPEAAQLCNVETSNALEAVLSGERVEELLREKVLRVIFQQGFFKVRDTKLELVREEMELHVPYWLGFYGQTVVTCRVIDAVRRRIEGAKASAFFEEWLAA
ncbi:MAG TPA: hypothetical protein VGI16_09235 [Candidatus Acidoferrum sp.]